jgi:methylated-DNA-[protein]-cysteine S-methyltransferase
MSENCQKGVGCRGYSRGMHTSTATPPEYLRRIDSPIGRIEVASDGTSVTSLSIERAGTLPWQGVPERSTPVLDRAAEQLAEYFAGTRTRFDVPVAPRGTEFQKAVWNELAALNFGEVASYGEIGRATGRPTAGRAVGGAVGANPVPIIIPCHRVLASNNRITGYSGGNGIPTKVWLLDHEGIEHAA